jgi:hypothetical protein
MNWETIIRHYNSNHRPHKEEELDCFRRQPSLEAAIILAARAKDNQGKHFSHQNKIPREAYPEARRLLLEHFDEVQKCKSFHELWMLLKEILEPVHGLGELYIYDTAVRIGAHLNLLPDRVYLHRGTRDGAKAFGFVTKKKEWLNLDELPKPLGELPAHEIEDILCIYKDKALPAKGCSQQRHAHDRRRDGC